MKAETGLTASSERSRIRDARNDLLQNVARALGPDERLGFFVVMSDVLVDGFDRSDTLVNTPTRKTRLPERL